MFRQGKDGISSHRSADLECSSASGICTYPGGLNGKMKIKG